MCCCMVTSKMGLSRKRRNWNGLICGPNNGTCFQLIYKHGLPLPLICKSKKRISEWVAAKKSKSLSSQFFWDPRRCLRSAEMRLLLSLASSALPPPSSSPVSTASSLFASTLSWKPNQIQMVAFLSINIYLKDFLLNRLPTWWNVFVCVSLFDLHLHDQKMYVNWMCNLVTFEPQSPGDVVHISYDN